MRTWYVVIALWALLIVGFFVLVLVRSANAADPITCALYADNVEQWTRIATHDEDVAMASRTTAEAWCFVLDEPPIIFQTESSPPPTKVNMPAPTAKPDSDWVQRCRKNFASFREEDGTVIRRGTKKRIRCPL